MPVTEGSNTAILAHGNTLYHHPELFASGQSHLATRMKETGLYVLRRDRDGSLHIVHKYLDLGELAANLFDLDPREK